MSVVLDILSWILLVSGGLFCITGGIGVLRMPDLYTRTHAASLTDTLGATLMVLGLVLQVPSWIVAVKLLLLLVLLFVTSPTSGHALVKAAYAGGVDSQDPRVDPEPPVVSDDAGEGQRGGEE